MKRQCRAFTLVELLVVIAIIGILAAILFPVFRRVRESGYQTNCASNLKQIGLAAQLYKQDERRYPGSLAFLLPATEGADSATLSNIDPPSITSINGRSEPEYQCGTDACPNPGGGNYLKSTGILFCKDDDADDTLRSSYGDISVRVPDRPATFTDASQMTRYLWNYLGYTPEGLAYMSEDEAATAMNAIAAPNNLLAYPDQPYNAITNPIKNSLSNRFAPSNTVITHCIFHRVPTANNLSSAAQLYSPPTGDDPKGARDLILLLDGSVKTLDVSGFNAGTPSKWQTQSF